MVALKHVLCPVDLSELSIRALAYAGSVAEWYASELTVQCPVLTVPSNAHTPARMTVNAVLCAVDFSAAALHALDLAIDVANRARASTTVLHVVEWLAEEDPRETAHFTVPEFRRVVSDMKADLIVLGAHGRGGPPLAGLGSTIQQVVRAAPCAVLTVCSSSGQP